MEAIRTDEEKKLEVQIKARFRQAMVENAVAFSSLASSQNNPTSGAIVNLDDEDGRFSAKDERQHFFVRTARFRKLKPSKFSILKSSKVSILSALKPSDLLDSPILQPARDQVSGLSSYVFMYMYMYMYMRIAFRYNVFDAIT
jgi:hypothetical protein